MGTHVDRHQPIRRPLVAGALALTLLGALAIALLPWLGGSGEAAAGRACPSPSAARAYTVAGGSGDVVAALTVVPQPGASGLLALRLLGRQDTSRAEGVSLHGADGRRLALAPSATARCLLARAPLAGLAPLRAAGRMGAERFSVRLPLPRRPRSAAALLARAHRATLALPALREVTTARPSLAASPTLVRTVYRGGVATSTSGGGVSRLRWPGWRRGFYWVSPGLQGARVIGTTVLGGRRLALVSGEVRKASVWMTLAIDPASGQVVRAAMLGAGHFMSSRFGVLSARVR